jgi:hypothetical protein
MCAPPGRTDLQLLVAAQLGGRDPPPTAPAAEHLRRQNALYLLRQCLERGLDGAYVDAVVDYPMRIALEVRG